MAHQALTRDDDEVWVSVGPSISAHKSGLHRELGRGFTVVDMLSGDRPPAGRTRIAVLGTSELPGGQILIRPRRRDTVVLVGTGARRNGHPPATVMADLIDTIRGLASASEPGFGRLAS
jgi:hypothetical protein